MKVTGKVFDSRNYIALPQVKIELKRKNSGVVIAKTSSNNEGQYTFDLSETENLKKGSHVVYLKGASHDSRSARTFFVDDPKSETSEIINLLKYYYPTSKKMGIGFVSLLFLILVGTIWFWYHAHKNWRTGHPSEQLISLISLAQRQAKVDSVNEVASQTIRQDSTDESIKHTGDSWFVHKTLNAIDSTAYDMYGGDLNCTSPESDSCIFSPTLSTMNRLLKLAKQSQSRRELQPILNQLKTTVDQLNPRFVIWNNGPHKYFELLIWALIATLMRLIILNSWYIYIGNFRHYVIPRHIGFLVAIPILALLISMLLSLINFSIKLGQSSLVLDLSDDYVIVLVAALIGFAPWQAWDFMKGLADRFFELLRGWLGKPSESEEATGTPETVEPDEVDPNAQVPKDLEE